MEYLKEQDVQPHVKALYLHYVDRGIGSWSDFAVLITKIYPNLEFIALNQNYSYPEGEARYLQAFLDAVRPQYLYLSSFQDNQFRTNMSWVPPAYAKRWYVRVTEEIIVCDFIK